MAKIDNEWVLEQFTAAKMRVQTGKTVLALLKAWEDIDVPDEVAADALAAFAKLARGHALVAPVKNEVWAEPFAGVLERGETVRVKADAYSGPEGILYNGRVGKVLAIRSGDVIVRSTDDKKPFLDSSHFPFNKLEKRVR